MLKSIARRQPKLLHLTNQAKLRSFRLTPKYKYGYEIPRNYANAKEINLENGNTKWQDATSVEMEQLDNITYSPPLKGPTRQMRARKSKYT